MQALRARGYAGKLALTSQTMNEADLLKRSGAHVVLLPFVDAAEHAVELLTPLRQSVSESPKEA